MRSLSRDTQRSSGGRPCTELPAFIIKRLPLRFIYDNNYFNDRFQGIPMGGYTQIIEKMLEGAEVKTDTDYFDFIKENPDIADKTVYTGMIDEFFGFQYGPLEYRSVRFETEVLDEENYQGNAVVNYTHRDVPYTRIIEHKHFEFGKRPKTVISREYSAEWKPGVEPYYPVNNDKNNALYEKYKELAETRKDVIFGGRLGQYKYYDMDKVIAARHLSVLRRSSNREIEHIIKPYKGTHTGIQIFRICVLFVPEAWVIRQNKKDIHFRQNVIELY